MRDTLLLIVLLTPPMLLAVTLHELAHGFVAYRLGDPTAKMAGRLTLNPIKHLDPIGTLVFVFTRMIGWAKPVPVNPLNMRDPKRDMIWVSLAGPAANILLAIVSAVFYHILVSLPMTNPFIVNKIMVPLGMMLRLSVTINIGLAVFNLLPIPPLDGSKIVMGVLPYRQAVAYSRIEPYGFFILIALIFLRVTDFLIFPIIIFLRNLLI
jgi:Zn-dependent protease